MFPYIGGKHKHIKWLDPLFPESGVNTFVEVFGGAGWVTYTSDRVTQAKTRIYNDFNPFIANIHEVFRTRHQELLQVMESYPTSNKDLYLQFQQAVFGDPNLKIKLGDVDLAAKYLYLQTQIFSGTTLSRDSYSFFQDVTSDGKYKSKYESCKNKFRQRKFTDRMEQVTRVENIDCIELIKKYDAPDTFFYVDPPYFKKEFLYTHEFPREKHEELADTLKNVQGRWCLSYYDFEELREWYPEDKFYWHSQDVFRWSSTRSYKREDFKESSRGTEIAVLNYTPIQSNISITQENFDRLFQEESNVSSCY